MGSCACSEKDMLNESTTIPVENASDSIISNYIKKNSEGNYNKTIRPHQMNSPKSNNQQPKIKEISSRNKSKNKSNTVLMRHSTFLMKTDINIKVYGQSSSGKTSFLNSLSRKGFNPVYNPSVHKEMIIQRMPLNSRLYDLNISIVQENEINKEISSTNDTDNVNNIGNYIGSNYHFVMFDLSMRKSFEYARMTICNIIRINMNRNDSSNIIMIGNKEDLKQQVSNEEIEAFIQEYSLLFFKISIKECIGINSMMNTLLNAFDKEAYQMQSEL